MGKLLRNYIHYMVNNKMVVQPLYDLVFRFHILLNRLYVTEIKYLFEPHYSCLSAMNDKKLCFSFCFLVNICTSTTTTTISSLNNS